MEYIVTLTEAEQKAMEHVALNVQDWITNAVHNRARQAIDTVAALEVERMTNDPKIRAIPANKNDLVMNSKLPSALIRQKEDDSKLEVERQQVLAQKAAEEAAKLAAAKKLVEENA